VVVINPANVSDDLPQTFVSRFLTDSWSGGHLDAAATPKR
jgi:hypothetical protein